MISVRSSRTTYLCLKDDSYTGFYTDLSREEQSTTHLTVLCSISFPQINSNKVVKATHPFFITICAASDSGGMEVFMFKKILVPTDASDYSKRSLEIALELARKFQAEVEVFHVTYTPQDYWGYTVSYGATVNQEDLNKNGQLALDLTVTGLNTDGVVLNKVLEAGHPVTKILEEIEKMKIDLVVMGSHGYGVVAGSVFGSVSQRILQKAPCPVLIAK